ncbi:unnamed protein product [Auanema sp. JU1783]|nr:unnamed protein product [Auanema sp. JU1783]
MYRVFSSPAARHDAIQQVFDEVDDNVHSDELLQKLFESGEIEDSVNFSEKDGEEEFINNLRNNLTKPMSKIDAFIEYVLKKINEQWMTLLYAVFPFHQVQTLVLICLVQFISVSYMLQAIPVAAAFISFLAMAYFTLKMFHNKRNSSTKQRLKDAVRSLLGPSEQEGTIDNGVDLLFQTNNNWEPYLNFFISLSVFILSVGAAEKYLPHCSIFFVSSLFFAITTFTSLTDTTDKYALFAMIANLLSCLPILLSRMHYSIGSWRIWKPIIQFRISYFNVVLGIPSFCLLSIPILYSIIILRKGTWKESWQLIVPHIVCISWSDVAMTVLMIGWKNFGIFDVLFVLGAAFLFLYPSYSLTAGALLSAFLVTQFTRAIDFVFIIKALLTVLLLFSPFILSRLWKCIPSLDKFKNESRTGKWILAFIYLSSLLMAISFLYEGQLNFDPSADVTNMTWVQYDKHCSSASANNVKHQIECSQLKGTAINWKGTIQSVRVVNIDNSFETLLGYLPESLSQTLRCFYDSNRTDAYVSGGVRPNMCSLTEHNVYTFEVDVSGPYGERSLSSSKGQVVLLASHVFFEQLKLVDEGDVVRFVGFFDQYPIFRYPPKLKLLQLECLNCKQFNKHNNRQHRITNSKLRKSGIWHKIFDSFRFCFNFVFAPVVVIK